VKPDVKAQDDTMQTLKERILTLVSTSPGLADREVTDRLLGVAVGQQAVNQATRSLEQAGRLVRRIRGDGKIGNYPLAGSAPVQLVVAPVSAVTPGDPSEDDVKRGIEAWLRAAGWQVAVKWGRDRGIDIDAVRDSVRWIIEAKGCGSRDQMRANYFVGILGELLQRMVDEKARYSIALPDMPQFRRLWARLPQLAKSRTGISALFVDAAGRVEEQQVGDQTAV
jgi:hypothetical protein